MNLRNFTSVKDRREALEKETAVSLSAIGSCILDEATASTRNCENMIGSVQVPVGVAGPIEVKSQKSKVKSLYLPLATTEGALVASANRGCKAVTAAGGVFVAAERVGTTRGPVFKTASLEKSLALKLWLETHADLLNEVAQTTSSHIKLLSQHIQVEGSLVFVRFAFDTQDAMGMNMVTIATEAMGKKIAEMTSATFLTVSANFCVDKKPSWQNVILGRGFRAWSEVLLSTAVIEEILKTSPDALYEVWETKCLIGSAVSGSMGFNGHAANVVAALFLATGQDIAHVVEGSTATTLFAKESAGIRVTVSLPSLMVGTVGGGTSLATQQEALQLLGIAGGNDGNNAHQLAEIVAGAVLAGEISELAALTSHTLACAHQQLGRAGK